MILFSAIKEKQVCFSRKMDKLDIIVLSKLNQSQTNMIFLVCDSCILHRYIKL